MVQTAANGCFKSQKKTFSSSPFLALSVGATGARVLLPKASDALLGKTFKGEQTKQSPETCRAQGLDPKPSPTDMGLKY
jgi:hypothetical protein